MELVLLILLIVLLVARKKRRPEHVGGDLVIWRAALFWLPLAFVAGWLALRGLALV